MQLRRLFKGNQVDMIIGDYFISFDWENPELYKDAIIIREMSTDTVHKLCRSVDYCAEAQAQIPTFVYWSNRSRAQIM